MHLAPDDGLGGAGFARLRAERQTDRANRLDGQRIADDTADVVGLEDRRGYVLGHSACSMHCSIHVNDRQLARCPECSYCWPASQRYGELASRGHMEFVKNLGATAALRRTNVARGPGAPRLAIQSFRASSASTSINPARQSGSRKSYLSSSRVQSSLEFSGRAAGVG